MEEIKARLKLTEVIMNAIRQGLTIDDLKKILKARADVKALKQA